MIDFTTVTDELRRVLAGLTLREVALGITEAAVGAPIVATMETVCVGRTAAGVDVYVGAGAYAAAASRRERRMRRGGASSKPAAS